MGCYGHSSGGEISIEFRILGPLELCIDGSLLPLGSPKQRALLGLLVAHANETVARDRLVDELWGETPPATVGSALHVYLSRLRRMLEAADADVALVREAHGYRLQVRPDQIDVNRFERAVGEASEALAAGQSRFAADRFRQALALWRGPALADLHSNDFAVAVAARLEERRVFVLEERLEADLALGRHRDLIGELETLVAEHPYRERLHAQLMLALYRSGRQAEALRVYRRARETLVTKLGIDPSADLQRLEREILAQDPALEVATDGGSQPEEAAFAPLQTLHGTNLPIPLTPFLGRERELEELIGLLSDEKVRLLTLTGPGGTGKTRLALQAAGRCGDRYRHGVWWVPLAPLRDPTLVLGTAARALGARNDLAEYVGDKSMLVLLDNFEHVVEAATQLASLLTSCPNLDLLVTSREPLHITAEQEYPVPPFAPDEGVSFFLARARAIDPDFQVDEAVPAICRRLDELPLALELAAARVKALSTDQMLDRLAHRLPLLTSGARDLPERQRTLRATIDWSYQLLTHEEQCVFARLAVFRGGCTLEAAQDVAGTDLDTIHSLVDKSLLRHTRDRFWMLETIREYAAERLDGSGQAEELRERHVRYFLALAEAAEPNLFASRKEWLDRLEQEHDNIRAAFDRLEASGDNERALHFAGTLWRFWYQRGHLREGRARLEGALNNDEDSTAERAKALDGATMMALEAGDPATARLRAEQGLALRRILRDAWGIAVSKLELGNVFVEEGDLATAQQLYEESIGRFRAVNDEHYALLAKRNLAWTCNRLDERERARALYEDALRQARALPNERIEAMALAELAMIALDEDRAKDARSMLKESQRINRDLGELYQTVLNLSHFARLLVAEGRAEIAAQLLSRSETLNEEIGARVRSIAASMNAETLTAIQAHLDEAKFAAAREQGRGLTVEEAIALAVDSPG